MWPASALLTGNGVAFVPGSRYRARRLVEHERLVDLRRDSRRRAAVEVRGHVSRPSHLQPVELRPRPLLHPDRPRAGGSAAVLVGPDVGVAGGGAGAHRRRRAWRSSPGCSWCRSPHGSGSTFAAGIAVLAATGHKMTAVWHLGPDRRLRALVDAGHVPRGSRLPVLHDHGSAHDPETGLRPGLRGVGRPARDAPDRAVDERVLGEASRCSGRSRSPSAARPLLLLAAGRVHARRISEWTGGRPRSLRLAGLGAMALAAGGAVVAAGLLSPAAPQHPVAPSALVFRR